MFLLRYILTIFFIFFYSCNNDGSVIYNVEEESEELTNDFDGYGCSPSTVCYPLEEIYYDFSGGALYQGFYKFDKAWSEGGFHSQESDTLGLYTFNDSYLMAVPSSFIESGSTDNTVIISDSGNFIIEELDNLSGLPSELVDLVSQPPIPRLRDSLLTVSSNAISNISNVVWNENQLRYIPNTANSATYSKSFYFTQEYDSIIQTTLIDTGNTPIIDDIILLDYNEIVKRTVTLYDSLDTGAPVKSKRNINFKVKNTFVSPDGPYWRENTDCNDNYQKDEEEVVLFDGYINSYGVNPKSFEAWCLSAACDDGSSLNEIDCCVNNPWGYGCTDGSNIDEDVTVDDLNPEELCCIENSGTWNSVAACVDENENELVNWDNTELGCTDNTSVTIWDYGDDWDHDGDPYNPIAFCAGYDLAFLDSDACIGNNGSWIEDQGTEKIPQTGAEGEPVDDDVEIGCSEGGTSESGEFNDCTNFVSNTSETIWDFGADWDHDGIPYVAPECLIESQSDCENLGLDWTSVLGGGFCSENDLDEAACLTLQLNWIQEEGTEDVPQDGENDDEPEGDDVAVGCSNGGTSELGDYTDCDNTIEDTSETIFDYGPDWDHDGIDFIPAYCFSDIEYSCQSFCYDSQGDMTDDDESNCPGSWMVLQWTPVFGTPEIPQTGAEGEPVDDDVAVGCSAGGTSELGDYTDCSNSSGLWFYSPGNCEGSSYEWRWIDARWDQETLSCENSNSDINWNNNIQFNIDSNDLCSTTCVDDNAVTITMSDFCWNYYDGSIQYNGSYLDEHSRLSGHCFVDDSEMIVNSNSSSNDSYYFAFCDTGNNLFDPPEYFHDSNNDGSYTTGANFQEAYEDRNCNNVFDGDGFSLNYSDLQLGASGYIDDILVECLESSYLSGVGDKRFCDRGNGVWDPPESHYCSIEDGINCEYSGNASSLFQRSDAPEIFLVNYDDWNSKYSSYEHYDATDDFINNSIELRKPLLGINPSSGFLDTGIDGCFDELENGVDENNDGIGDGCLCEFKEAYGNNDSLVDCEELMYSWYGDDLPNLWKKWHQIPKDNNGNYLAADIVITEFDVGLSEFSPFNYGECSNGFSGSNKDCCEYYSCEWNDGECDWNSDSCVNNDTYCQNDITSSCVLGAECGGISNICSNNKWIEDIDPNNDNYWSSNACYYDGSCESDNVAPLLDSLKTQSNDKWDFAVDSNSNIIANEKTDQFSNAEGNVISSEEYYSSPGLYAAYHPHVSLPDFVVSKQHLYSSNSNIGNDTLFVIDEQMKSVQVLVSDPIVESRNTIKSRKVIDQAGFSSSDHNTNFCEVAYNACSSTTTGYEACLDSSSSVCEVSSEELIYRSNECSLVLNEIDCLNLSCIWGNPYDECSQYTSDTSCYYEYDMNANAICDSVEDDCSTNEFDTCMDDLTDYLELTFYQDLLSNFYIMKTEYGYNDYDYLLFDRSSNEYVVQMTHPYYHYQSNNSLPTDIDDFICEDGECFNFWENTLLKPDTLLYSHDGNIIDGQVFVSSEMIETDNGTYLVEKTYEVNSGVAELEYPIYNPALYNSTCGSYSDAGSCCGAGEECGSENNCNWITPPDYDPGLFSPYCDNKSSSFISDCLIVTRIINTTTMGPGQGFRLRTVSYLKPDYKLVKETLEISWDTSPWLDENTNWSFVSGIEYRNSTTPLQTNANPDNFLVDYQTVNINDFHNMPDFNYSPFKLSKTMGIMRYDE